MSLWGILAASALTSAALKAAGPALLLGRELSPRAKGVVAHLAPALLGALVAVQSFGGDQLTVDARALGVASAAAALAARLPTLVAVALAATVTALVRAVS